MPSDFFCGFLDIEKLFVLFMQILQKITHRFIDVDCEYTAQQNTKKNPIYIGEEWFSKTHTHTVVGTYE